jgi:ABC-2 type transport system permease protein
MIRRIALGLAAIFAKDVRLVLRDRAVLWLSVVAPVAMMTVIALARHGSAEPPLPLMPVVDEDGGPVARAFIELLGKHAEVVETTRENAEQLVRDLNRCAAAIVFPAGLSKRYLQGRPSQVMLLTDPAQSVALNTVRALLLVMDRDAAELADPLHEELLIYREENLTSRELSPKSLEQNVPGFAIMFVLLAAVFGTASAMHDERTWGTLTRLLLAPAGLTALLAGKLGVRCVLAFLQTIVLLGWGRLALEVSLGSSPLALVALSAGLAFAAAALGLFVAALASTREQTLPLSLAATLALAALGGLWWPISIVPDWMRIAGEVWFPTWAMYGMTDLILRERGLGAILVPLAVMIGQGMLLLAAGGWIFRLRHMTT